jgi:hypothetical protein
MDINLTLYSFNPSNEFDLVNFSVEKEHVKISLKCWEDEDNDILDKIIDIDIEDFKKLAKIINDINL